MPCLLWLRHSAQIAQTERTRSRRRRGRSSLWRAFIAVVVVLIAAGLAVGAYEIGSTLRRGQFTLPLVVIRTATTAGFLLSIWRFTRRASSRIERVDTDLLLTTVPAREVALGVMIHEYSRVAVPISLPVLGVALGFAIGIRSPATALMIIVAVAGFVAFSLLVGFVLGLSAGPIAEQLPFIRRYRRVFSLVAYLLPTIVALAVFWGVVPLASVIRWLRTLPFGWFIDLGLLGVPGVQSGFLRGVGALCFVVLGCPLFVLVTARLAKFHWYAEPVSPKTTQHSQALVNAGIAERLFGNIVSQPTLTVARKTWLYERRVPAGLLSATIVVYIPILVGIYVLKTGKIPTIAPMLLAFAGAWGTSFVFGINLLGKEYPVLPMTLTAITGRQFVRGIVLAGVAVGATVTTLITLIVGLVSPVGVVGAVLVALVGGLLCVCGITLAAVASLRVSYRDIMKVPLPYLEGNIYSDAGWSSFIDPFAVLLVLTLVSLPVFVSYLSITAAFLTTVFGIPIAAIHIGGAVLTAVLSAGISKLTYQRAIRLFNQYTITRLE